ncbi:hypothetical protein G9A89_014577 [Geosiphon pyriformis]|nr:hypothetical protein G9A89_014577 [Geosiphon pyriformis]
MANTYEHRLHLMKTIEHIPITTANHVTRNAIDTPNNKTSRTMNHVLLVENSYSTKKCEMTFLVKEKYAMPHANTQSSLVTGSVMEHFLIPHETVFWHVWTATYMTKTRSGEWQVPKSKMLYPNAIKLESHSCICIDLKVVLKIKATTMVQLAFRSSLAKKKIIIRERIIDAGYVENIIAMLQNNSEKAYIIEPNEKIAQAIFLSLVKIAQLILVEDRKELRITAKRISEFKFMGKIDVPVNMAEEKIINKEEIISTHQSISILSYDQYMLAIKRKVKNQVQIFEAEVTLCKSEKIGLINLHIPAKNHSHIKIPIYNNMGDIIEIPEKTTIGYLITEIENQLPNPISDFLQLCEYVDITSQTIYRQNECYLLQPKQLK